jgi:hypothetical protein
MIPINGRTKHASARIPSPIGKKPWISFIY